MAKPKEPPTSLRVPEATKAAVEHWAAMRKIAKNAAYVELINVGLKSATAQASANVRITVAPAPPTVAPRPDGSLVATRAFTPKAGERFTGVTASGEPLPQRRATPKGAKK